MLTAAEELEITRDRLALELADYCHCDLPDSDVDQIIEYAIDVAIDEFDAEIINDEIIDATDYEMCAEKAFQWWKDVKEDEYYGRGDYLDHLSRDA